MRQLDDISTDEAADTLRFIRIDPDATSIYDLTPAPTRYVGRSVARRRRQIRDTRENVLRLREVIAEEGWDIGPELVHEERRLAALEASARRSP